MTEPLRLPAEMSIYTAVDTAAALRDWLAGLDGSTPAQVQGADVAEIDGAGLQLLVALQHSLTAAQHRVEWRVPSRALSRACRLAGPGAPFFDAAAEATP